MTAPGEIELDSVDIRDEASQPRRRLSDRGNAVAMVWPSTPSAREQAFERWQGAAMRCLRAADSDFAVIISFRKLLRPDGRITASNSELAVAAGCSAKTLEFDLGRLKAASLIISSFHSVKGFAGRRRVIRLSLPDPHSIPRIWSGRSLANNLNFLALDHSLARQRRKFIMNHIIHESTMVSTAAQIGSPEFHVGDRVLLAHTDEEAVILAIDGGVAWVYLGPVEGHETVDLSEMRRPDQQPRASV